MRSAITARKDGEEIWFSKGDAASAGMIAAQPIVLQLRFLQTISEIASEQNTTTFIPLPIDLFTPFLRKAGVETAKQ